ncbi:MAG: hypothetical protein WC819_03515 [Parcubacteria group bacterium]|jgi:hypothetical protein
MNIFKIIKETQAWDDHKESVFFIFVTIFFSFLPIWLTFFYVLITDDNFSINQLWKNGEFFIYSAALLGSAIHMMRGYSKKPVNLSEILYMISWVVIIFSAVGYMATTVVPTKTQYIGLISGIFVLYALGTIYYAHYRQSQNLDPDQENKESQRDIMNQLS